MTDFQKVLLAVCPHGRPEILSGFAGAMQSCIDYADLSTHDRLAAFIGQCAEESASFRTTVEYASGRAYNGRRDLGNVYPGDGPRFKGRGLIQITGRANYEQASKEMGVDFIAGPGKMAEFPYAAWAADRYWKQRNLNPLADRWDIPAITLRVNGGFNGLAERRRYSDTARAALADLRGTLLAAAKTETKKAKVKAAVATAAASPALAPIAAPHAVPVAHAAASGVPGWAILAGIAAVALIVAGALALAVRKHQLAAAALTEAAKAA